MLGLFKSVTPLVKPKPKVEVPRPDNLVFRLHYRLTFCILCVCCILVSSYSYIDRSESSIQCMLNKGSMVRDEVINRYCWIMSTFTLPKYFKGERGEDFIHPGVGALDDDDEKVYHAYYQWVPIMLFFQGLCFYAPHWLWKHLEGGRMKAIIVGLNNYIESDETRKTRVKELAGYMRERMKLTTEHKWWAFKFFLCEMLNFINVIAQIFITDAFLGGEFTSYGTEVINFPSQDVEDRIDPMSRVFPRMTKCTFHKYGGSGTIQRLDALCVLGMNILNEKIYIFLWFWFIILAVITGISLLVRVVQFISPRTRDRFVKLENRGHVKKLESSKVQAVIKRLNYSDWLILYYLAQSMDRDNFTALLADLAGEPPEYSSDGKVRMEMKSLIKPLRNDEKDGTMPSSAKLPRY